MSTPREEDVYGEYIPMGGWKREDLRRGGEFDFVSLLSRTFFLQMFLFVSNPAKEELNRKCTHQRGCW
jgi:hypothetical protein